MRHFILLKDFKKDEENKPQLQCNQLNQNPFKQYIKFHKGRKKKPFNKMVTQISPAANSNVIVLPRYSGVPL